LGTGCLDLGPTVWRTFLVLSQVGRRVPGGRSAGLGLYLGSLPLNLKSKDSSRRCGIKGDVGGPSIGDAQNEIRSAQERPCDPTFLAADQ